MTTNDHLTASFYQLSADHVLDSVEHALDRKAIGRRATGSVLALNSLENRVYQIEFEDGKKFVTKFYRPKRWSKAQILEEHEALLQCEAAEIPVVCPVRLDGVNGETLATSGLGIHFAIFPHVRGRLLDELQPENLRVLGRYLARIHRVLSSREKSLREKLDIETFGWQPFEMLMESEFFESDALAERYDEIVGDLLEKMSPLFDGVRQIRVHGDCHLGNTLWQGDQPFFLDFDDLAVAPAVQDIWMIVRGRDVQAIEDREILISAYEQMNEFNRSELGLIEPLRALRIIHYSHWIAKRWEDPSFSRAFPDFGTARYWNDEMNELLKISDLISGTH
jgi:Ser/Thr protein kinase RdoA (MazF antagonist)